MSVGWEDILGLVVTLGLLWYLLRAMLKAEEI
jgi:K+-transporting ATPase KdpF subunit